jgi:hypothetical protein
MIKGKNKNTARKNSRDTRKAVKEDLSPPVKEELAVAAIEAESPEIGEEFLTANENPAEIVQESQIAGQERAIKEQSQKGEIDEGVKMSEKLNEDKMFDSVSRLSESFNLDGVKKAAAWYIDTSEKLANQALDLQERATGWAKDTPFAPIFEAQHSMAKKFVERSASVARNLWQIH